MTVTGDQIAAVALSQSGKQYKYGAATDPSLRTLWYDCSSFVQSVFQSFGTSFTWRTSQAQANAAAPISAGQAQAGDLAFGSFSGTDDHVGIYLGGNKVISALDEAHGVVVTDVSKWPSLHFGRLGYTSVADGGDNAPSEGNRIVPNPSETPQFPTIALAAVIVGVGVYAAYEYNKKVGWTLAFLILLGIALRYPSFADELTKLLGGTAGNQQTVVNPNPLGGASDKVSTYVDSLRIPTIPGTRS